MITCQRATVQHLRRSPGVVALAGRDFALMLPAKPSALVLQETDSVFWIVAWEIYSPALLETNLYLSRAIAFLFSSAACSARNNCTSPSLSFSLSLACMGNSIYESVFSLLLSLCAGKDSELRVHICAEKEMKEVFFPFFVFDIKARALLLVITLSYSVSGAQSGSNAQTLYCTRACHRWALVCACAHVFEQGHIKLPFWRRSVSCWNHWINGWDSACTRERWRDMWRMREGGIRWRYGEIVEWHKMVNVISNG